MNDVMKDLLLVQSFDLSDLIEKYRLFFIGLLPSVFILAVLIEYLDRLEPFTLVKRAFISVLILTSITTFYQKSIEASMSTADEILRTQKNGNILLMDMFDGIKHWDKLNGDKKGHEFYKDKNVLWGTLAFLKYHLFDSFVNDGFTVTIFFITKICFLILKVVYSLVYYLGYGLIGIPCLLYLFPSMGNVLRGAILSFLWCLIVPHILVFIISMIGTEINKGYVSGQIIGGSMVGTALLFILTLFIAFTPLIGAMILNGSGISQAGGIIASIGANYVMNLPKNTVNNAAIALSGGTLGPKMKLASGAMGGSYKLAKGAKNVFGKSGTNKNNPNNTSKNSSSKFNGSTNSQNLKSNSQTSHSGKANSSVNSSDTSRNSKSNGSNTNTSANSKTATQNNKTIKGEKQNGTISKHGKVYRRTEKANRPHSSNKRTHSPDNFRNRNTFKQRRK